MRKLNRIKWYNKSIIIGVLMVLVLNPLSLIFISSGLDLAILTLGDIIQLGVKLAIDYSLYPMITGVVAIILGGGAYLGARENKQNIKLKKMKNRPTKKAGEYIEA